MNDEDIDESFRSELYRVPPQRVEFSHRLDTGMTPASVFNGSVHQFQGKLFAHALAHEANVGCTGYHLANWWRRTHSEFPEQPLKEEWFLLFEGRLPKIPIQNELTRLYPELEHILKSPLWFSLSESYANGKYWDSCAETILVNNSTLGRFDASLIVRLCGRPCWSRLAYIIILLRSRTPKFAKHRRWLRDNFLSYLCLSCMSPPLFLVRHELFSLLDKLYSRKRFGNEGVANWPSSIDLFDWELMSLKTAAAASLAFHGWISHPEDEEAPTLIWVLMQEKETLQRLLLFSMMHHKYPMENDVKVSLQRSKQELILTSVAMDYSKTPPMGRYLSRLGCDQRDRNPQ
ncbi:hypothetical protein ACFW0H_27065 [Pseudomonas sp. CR3202]|uniref:hypothetical protein n=1 Tax=Pseudomonas sp. CR3202 TaxID=3351532 RepID=UPI003BF2D866